MSDNIYDIQRALKNNDNGNGKGKVIVKYNSWGPK